MPIKQQHIAKCTRVFATLFVLFACVALPLHSQTLINATQNAIIQINNNAVIRINGGITLGNGTQLTQSGPTNIEITGDWVNNGGTFTPDIGTVTFLGTANSQISGTGSTTFNELVINKTGVSPNNRVSQSHTVTVNSDLTISNGEYRAGTGTQSLTVFGDILNNAALDLNIAPNTVATTFRGNANSLISGTGATNDFHEIIVNKDALGNEVQVASSAFTATAGYLTLTRGTFHITGTVAYPANTVFKQTSPNNYDIPANSAFWLDNPNVTVTGQNANANLTGRLRLTSGIMSIGTAANQNHLLYSSGSELIIENATLNIEARLSRGADAAATINYTQSGGLLNIGIGVNSSANNRGAFDIGSSSSSFTWSGGTIELRRPSANTDANGGDFFIAASNGSVSAGTLLRINAAAAAQTHRINTVQPIGELLINAANNPIARLLTSDLTVLGNITVNSVGAGRIDANNLNITVGGNWNNNSTDLTGFTAGTGRVTFNGSADQYIQGTARTTYNNASINKSAGKLLLGVNTIFNGDMRLISSLAKLDIRTYNLTLGPSNVVYSDDGVNFLVNPGAGFTSDKCILYSATDESGGNIIRNLSAGSITNPTIFNFPLGTKDTAGVNDVYTPARIVINEATVLANANLTIKPVPREHPNVRTNNMSIRKYWKVTKNQITFGANRADLRFWYAEQEVRGNEGNYRVLRYSAPTWLVDPGISAVVSFNTNEIISERPSDAQFNGDWTAGEEDAARAKYYSIDNGNYSNPNTWSKISFGGPVSNTAPNDASDNVFIGDGKTVTVTAAPNISNLVEVRNTGTLLMGNFTFTGDTLRVKAGGKIGIGNASGIVQAPTASGNVQTTVRIFDSSATYEYNGGAAQVTGNALPLRVQTLICNKPAAQTLTVTNNVTIGDSLIIVNGILDNNGRDLNGESAGRTLIMQGGEFILRKNFPVNYTPPTFTVGRINFDGTSNIRIPSSGSTPGVLQYNDLRIAGARGYGDIVFEPDGEIPIQGALTINNLSFTVFNTGNTRIRTDGSTIVFNGADQNIPRNSATAGSGDDYRLYYHNLKIAGTGTKSLIDGQHRIYNEIILESATLSANTQDIELRGNWNNTGGDFSPGTRTVFFNIVNASTTKTVKARNIAFNNINIQGLGTLQNNDLAGDRLPLVGNWVNTADFNPGTGTVEFRGTALQSITNVNREDFYNLIINNNANVQLAANTNILVSNNLDFAAGRLDARTNNRTVFVDGSVSRSGTGHVDGNLSINIPTGTVANVDYHIGAAANYRPITLAFNGTDGSAGYLNLIDNARTINLAGSTLNAAQNVERQWDATIPIGSTFAIGTRTIATDISYIAGDLRGGANPSNFETRRWTGSAWTVPTTGNRGTYFVESSGNAGIGTFVIGPPGALTFYSIANGNWNSASTWSTAGYGGAAAASAPVAGSKVFIGDGFSVTLNLNYATNAGDSVVVEQAGPSGQSGRLLLSGTNQITGTGNFALRNGGVLEIQSTEGISLAPSATGHIRTSVRNYNEGTHNNGHFVYSGTGNQNTGDGLPATIATLTISKSNGADIVTLSSGAGISIKDSINITNGVFDVSGANRNITLQGNWRNSGAFNERNALVSLTGSGLQLITNASDETFYNLTINKSAGKVKLEPSTDIVVSNVLTLTSGIIDSRSNDVSVILPNGSTVSRTSGHVDGEMRKYASAGAGSFSFEIGDDSDYTPASIDINGAGGTAGLVSAKSFGLDHPDIATSGLDLIKNVQRYWKLGIPAGSLFALGGRNYDMTVQFLNPDDIRGGANTNNFVLRQHDGAAWNATVAGLRTGTTTEATAIAAWGIDFAVGELGTSRVFFTRADGDWDDVNTWSETAYGGPVSGNWPDNINDVVNIGNGNEVAIVADRTVSSVTVENVGGMGVLNMSTFILSGNQFVLKSGGKLKIGSINGITGAGAFGNIQTNIRNYNHNTHNNGNFEYTESAQNTGTGLPSVIASLTINTSATTVNMSNIVEVTGDISLQSGTLSSNSMNITLGGDWINNSTFTANSDRVTLNGASDQIIQGSSVTTFFDLRLNKSGGDVDLQNDLIINGTLDFNADGKLKLNTSDITFGTSAQITGTTDENRMIESDGTASSGRLIKLHSIGNGVSRDFTYPIGVGSEYNEAVINIYGNFAANAQTSMRLRSGLHPNRLNDNQLNKYWQIENQNITVLSDPNTDYHFTYQAPDVNGNQSNYIPARFAAGAWEVNLGTSRDATVSPINIQAEAGLDGDWTAGEPASIFAGRVYYSRNTGNWNNNNNWSNISHAGQTAVYYPGQKFPYDTVLIAAGHTIDYNVLTALSVGYVRIGESAALAGVLRFLRGSNKKLSIAGDIDVNSNGTITETGAGNRFDTLDVGGNFINSGTAPNAVDFRIADVQFTILRFNGDGTDTVRGNGNWRLSGVIIRKPNGLADTLVNQAINFSNAVNTATALAATTTDSERFLIQSGIYCHDNANPTIMNVDRDGNNDGASYQLGVNSGINQLRGDIRFQDDFITNTNTSVFIQGGTFRVGRDNEDHQSFRYLSETSFRMTGGEARIQASFSREQPNAYINFDMSGGTLRVVIARNQDGIGFDIAHNSSTFTQSGGTIVITDISNPGDYAVNAGTVNVTGGTLQIGEIGDPFFSTGGDIAVGNYFPTIWNLVIRNTRSATNLRALICNSNPLYVINDIIIETNGCLDLNTFSIELGGDFLNDGTFDTDGPGWDDTGIGSLKRITMVGDGTTAYGRTDQTIRITNPLVVAQDPPSATYRNESFYELIINKPNGGRIILDNTANSNLLVRNLLQFAQDNNAIIDARTNNKFVYSNGQLAGDQGRIERLTGGHVDGTLRRDIGTAAQNIKYYIGNGFDYTPATLVISGAGGTAGPVDMITYGVVHPQIASNAFIDLARDIERYWTMSRPTGAFALGGRTYSINLEFLDTDIPGGASWTLFEHYVYPSGGPWSPTAIGTRTTNSTQSINNTIFNNSATDYIIGESAATNYYSYQDGNWSDPASWSLTGYGVFNPPALAPSGLDAQVYIGDNKNIFLDRVDSVKALVVEVAAGGPGHLDASTNFILGLNFSLDDGAFLTTANEFGIRQSQNAGSIRTNNRIFRTSHYTYNSAFLSQSTGDGLPSTIPIASLTINNSAADSASSIVFLTNDVHSEGNILIQDGNFFGSNKTIRLEGDFIVNNGASFIPYNSTFEFIHPSSIQNLTLNDPNGVSFNILNIDKPDGSILINGTSASGYAYVRNRLKFTGTNNATINSRTNNRKVVINSGAVVERVGLGHIDGILQKPIGTDVGPYLFEIGNGTTYTPATLSFNQAGGTAGQVDAINISPVPDEQFYGNRLDLVRKVDRYWILDPQSGFGLGLRRPNVRFQMPPADIANITLSNTIIRRKSIPAAPLLWTERRYQEPSGDLLWNLGTATVELKPAANFWEGLGEFYIGEKAKRVFYSRNGGGDWNDNNSWAFDAPGAILAPAGEFPNNDWNALPGYEYETRDSVVIQNNDIITLNTLPELANIELLDNSTLTINDGFYLEQSHSGLTNFEMRDNSWINNKSPLGIQSDTSQSIIRFVSRLFEPTVNFEFSGIIQQTFGDAFPTDVQNIIISNTGGGLNNIVSQKPGNLRINGDLSITAGDLRPLNGTSAIELLGDLTINGSLNGNINVLGAATASDFSFLGNSGIQNLSGTGSAIFHNMLMDLGAAASYLQVDLPITISNTLDLQRNANANNQIVTIANNGSVAVTNTNPNSILDASGSGTLRYFRTSTTSGSLIRTLTQSNNYLYPVGSFDEGIDRYTPAQFTASNSGADGTVAVRVSRGTNPGPQTDGHLHLVAARTTDYLMRYWAIDAVTTTIPGQWRFTYLDPSDISGDEADIVSIGRWRPVREAVGGAWIAAPGTVTQASNYFETIANYPAGNFEGDWTIANAEAFRRIFYSRQSGLWDNDQTWTYSFTHSGPIFGPGIWPNDPMDSVVVGGGNAGIGNHEVILTVNTPNNINFGVALGTNAANTGTLDCGTNIIYGGYFSIGDQSTLRIGSADGISLLGNPTGNIQTSITRDFFGPGINAIYEYNGNQNQVIGSGLPLSVRSLGILNTGISGNNIVSIDRDIDVQEQLYVNQGVLDLASYSAGTLTNATLQLSDNATIMIGGVDDISTSLIGFSTYNISPISIFEFYGSNPDDQTISNLPINLTQDFVLNTGGLGHVILRNSGTKFVTSPLLIRGDLTIIDNAVLQNNIGVNALSVRGNIINSSTINNNGVIEIGN